MFWTIVFFAPLLFFVLALVVGAANDEEGARHHRLCDCGRCERRRIERNLNRGL